MDELLQKTRNFQLQDETIELHSERALFLVSRKVLVLSDPRFPGSDFFVQKAGGTRGGRPENGLDRLDALLEHTAARVLIVLGGFLDEHERIGEAVLEAVNTWRCRHSSLRVILVKGTEDRNSREVAGVRGIEFAEESWGEFSFLFSAQPRSSAGCYVFSGGVHPCVTLFPSIRGDIRIPCFLFTKDYALLPSFGKAAASHEVLPAEGDHIFAIAGNAIHETVVGTAAA